MTYEQPSRQGLEDLQRSRGEWIKTSQAYAALLSQTRSWSPEALANLAKVSDTCLKYIRYYDKKIAEAQDDK